VVKRVLILFCLLYLNLISFAQGDTVSSSRLNTKRLVFVAVANAAFYAGSFITLNQVWYADYPKTKFHFFNDNPEWNQMDKAGHVWSTYHVSRTSAEMWRWTGLRYNQSAILGGVSGMVYQSIIEIQDAYSAEWGFSWGDVGANVLGSSLFVLQDIAWKDQRIQVKLGYWPYKYPDALKSRRDELFGSSTAERILKDYNSQTYWFSGNLSSFFPDSKIPKWLNMSVGYSAEGMYGGRTNKWTDKEGTVYDYTSVKRIRKFYLSPDIDLTRIPVKSKLLRSVFFVLNSVKIPAPALEMKNGKMNVRVR
jgi:hypothetical protein